MVVTLLLLRNSHHKQKTLSDFQTIGGGADVRTVKKIISGDARFLGDSPWCSRAGPWVLRVGGRSKMFWG